MKNTKTNKKHVQLKYGSREDINFFLKTISNKDFGYAKNRLRTR